jgi:anti-sigma regulatory factor (Ser/Thr protein kinase)
MTGPLRCATDRAHPVASVRLSGYLDDAGMAAVRATVVDNLAAEPEVLVIDLGQLIVGTHELGPAVAALARQAGRWPGCALALACAPAAVAALAGVEVYPSVVAARRAHTGGRRRDGLREALPASTVAAPLARRLLEQACLDWSVPELSDPAQLVVTELVANAIRHAGDDFTLTASLRGGHLRIAVADDNPALPRRGEARPTDEHGRGLLMVEALCQDWGAMRLGAGKIVWALLAPPSLPRRETAFRVREEPVS